MLKQIVVGLPVLLALDFVWLGLLMGDFYKRQLGSLARRSGESLAPLWLPAVLLYVIMVAGMALFVLPRAAVGGTVLHAAGWGAVFGFVSFAVYDLTNYATLEGWPLTMTIVDLAWGTILGATVSAAMFTFAGR